MHSSLSKVALDSIRSGLQVKDKTLSDSGSLNSVATDKMSTANRRLVVAITSLTSG